jgi:hypothetical protein
MAGIFIPKEGILSTLTIKFVCIKVRKLAMEDILL